MTAINNWRKSHAYPLQAIKMTLKGRARRVDTKAVVAQRLKRLTSIHGKLSRFPHMKLSQMQDIGGCRAVVSGIPQLETLVDAYANAKRRKGRSELCNIDDYIGTPKEDGYRGIHLVYKYRTQQLPGAELAKFDGLRIEVQLRSSLQHAWATAVEIVDAFTDQALKTGFGREPWKHFFRLAASVLALREHLPVVANTPTDETQLLAAFRRAEHGLNAVPLLQGFQYAIQHATSGPENAKLYLLMLNSKQMSMQVQGFAAAEQNQAVEQYLERERRIANDPDCQVVLVAVDSLAALKAAYPNYYLNAARFLSEVKRVLS
ncbi:RelA/SpoT domain-containing protein [Pseudomonadota bacterium]